MSSDFKVFFLSEFTKELIKNSRKAEEISSQKIIRNRIKRKIEERISLRKTLL